MCSSAFGWGFFVVYFAFAPKTWILILFQISIYPSSTLGQRLSSYGQQVPSLRTTVSGV